MVPGRALDRLRGGARLGAAGDDRRTARLRVAAVEAGREDHAFAQAEAHLARREVGDEHHLASHQRGRIAVAGADAGEDLPLAEFAGVEPETQQLVGALDEAALEHHAHPQVEPGEVVDFPGALRGRTIGHEDQVAVR